MKFFVAIVALAACAVAIPIETYPVAVYQDTLGNYKLKYTLADSARHEESNNGQVFGSYEFTDKHTGEHHKVYYLSGTQGYLPEGKSLPKPVAFTPEVLHATAEHNAIYRKIASELPKLSHKESDPEYVEHEHQYVPVEHVHQYVPIEHVHQYVPVEYHTPEVHNYGGPADTADVAALKALHKVATKHAAHYTH